MLLVFEKLVVFDLVLKDAIDHRDYDNEDDSHFETGHSAAFLLLDLLCQPLVI